MILPKEVGRRHYYVGLVSTWGMCVPRYVCYVSMIQSPTWLAFGRKAQPGKRITIRWHLQPKEERYACMAIIPQLYTLNTLGRYSASQLKYLFHLH